MASMPKCCRRARLGRNRNFSLQSDIPAPAQARRRKVGGLCGTCAGRGIVLLRRDDERGGLRDQRRIANRVAGA